MVDVAVYEHSADDIALRADMTDVGVVVAVDDGADGSEPG